MTCTRTRLIVNKLQVNALFSYIEIIILFNNLGTIKKNAMGKNLFRWEKKVIEIGFILIAF